MGGLACGIAAFGFFVLGVGLAVESLDAKQHNKPYYMEALFSVFAVGFMLLFAWGSTL